MFKSFLAALALVAAMLVAPKSAQAQDVSQLQYCTNQGCMYYVYRLQPAPGGGYEWVVVACEWVPGPQNESLEPIE